MFTRVSVLVGGVFMLVAGVVPLILLPLLALGIVEHPWQSSSASQTPAFPSLGQSIIVALVTSTSQIAMALGLTWLLYTSRLAFRSLHYWALLPLCVPALAVAFTWRVLFAAEGPLPAALHSLGITSPPWLSSMAVLGENRFSHFNWGQVSVWLVDSWTWTPLLVALFVYSARRVPQRITDAAIMDGAGARHVFWCIIVPITARWIVWLWLARFVDNLRAFDTYWVLFRAQPDIRSFAIELYGLFVSRFQYSDGASVSLASIAVSALVLVGAARLDRRYRRRMST